MAEPGCHPGPEALAFFDLSSLLTAVHLPNLLSCSLNTCPFSKHILKKELFWKLCVVAELLIPILREAETGEKLPMLKEFIDKSYMKLCLKQATLLKLTEV